jgi:hypothetical protein
LPDLKNSDAIAGNKQLDGSSAPIYVKEDTSLSIGAIIGIACAVALFLALFFYVESRRRNLARQVGDLSGNRSDNSSNGEKKGFELEGAKPTDLPLSNPKLSRQRKSSSKKSAPPHSPAIEEINEAINDADWDNVYRLASLLAENDEGYSLPDVEIPITMPNRTHLNEEDQERTKTLDELVHKRDWTGLAVTAALYAGESGSSHVRSSTKIDPPSNITTIDTQKKKSKSFHHVDNEWKKVNLLSLDKKSEDASDLSAGSDVEQGQVSMDFLVSGLSAALNAGDWAQVNYFANRIKEEKGQNGSNSFVSDIPDTQAMVLAAEPRLSSNMSSETTDTDMSRKQTIEKLVRAEKWKGVSIMANLYEMESKQANSSTRPPAQQPRIIKPGRTKELRHADRVEENIAGFRQEGDTSNNPIVPYFG